MSVTTSKIYRIKGQNIRLLCEQVIIFFPLYTYDLVQLICIHFMYYIIVIIVVLVISRRRIRPPPLRTDVRRGRVTPRRDQKKDSEKSSCVPAYASVIVVDAVAVPGSVCYNNMSETNGRCDIIMVWAACSDATTENGRNKRKRNTTHSPNVPTHPRYQRAHYITCSTSPRGT